MFTFGPTLLLGMAIVGCMDAAVAAPAQPVNAARVTTTTSDDANRTLRALVRWCFVTRSSLFLRSGESWNAERVHRPEDPRPVQGPVGEGQAPDERSGRVGRPERITTDRPSPAVRDACRVVR